LAPAQVVFIAGAGRSGSTLLEQLLTREDGVAAMGEVHNLWLRGYIENNLCACGSPFFSCPFWTEVLAESLGRFGAADAKRLLDLSPYGSRASSLLALPLRSRLLQRRPTAIHYLSLLRGIYPAAAKVARASLLVDSSKDPRHGMFLAKLDTVDLHVVHLVRDARAVAFSWQRQLRRPEVQGAEEMMPVFAPTRTARLWMLQNIGASSLRSLASSYTLLRYEDLIQRPSESLRTILHNVGRRSHDPAVTSHGVEIAVPVSHSVSGNPRRFAGRSLRLSLDEEWKVAMAVADRRKVSAIASPLLLRYGYLSSPWSARRHASR
jgi:hypothetical protein